MQQSGAVIESELLDLTGMTLEDIRACQDHREWRRMEQRLLSECGDPSLFADTKSSASM
jgi:hypothetical protein